MKALIIATTLLLLRSCSPPNKGQFDFVFKFGVGGKNELNTFDNTFTKDLVMDPPQKLALKLTAEEKQKIYNKLKEIDFDQMADGAELPCAAAQPHSTCKLVVTMDGHQKTIAWSGSDNPADSTCVKLAGLQQLIISIIFNRDEYKRAKPIRGGYL